MGLRNPNKQKNKQIKSQPQLTNNCSQPNHSREVSMTGKKGDSEKVKYLENCRENLSWIRMTRTVRQDARRSGKEDVIHCFYGRCLFGFYGEHNSKMRKGFCRDVT